MLRIKLRYDDVESMIQRFAPNVGKSGLFLPTKSLQAVGAEVKFELRLANDTAVLLGLGRVKAIKEPDPANPKASFGMAIELMRVTRESRDLILKMLERRKALGLPEVSIPTAADLDAARRDGVPTRDSRPQIESGPVPKIDSGPVAVPKDAITRESEPVMMRESGPIPAQIRDSGPIPARESGPIATRDSQPESLLTAPRRNTGPLAVVKVTSIAALAPEPPRRRRPAIEEVIEKASGPIAAVVVGLPDDIDVDVNAVIARARVLAGGDLDAELEALIDVAAAPIEIGIEAASAELARQLGGVAVRRGQSGWAPPPPVEESKPAAKVAATPEPIEAKPEVIEAKPEVIEAKPEVIEAKPEVIEAKPEPVVEAAPKPIAAIEPVIETKSEPIAPEPADTFADPDAASAVLDDIQTPVMPQEMLTQPGMEPQPGIDDEPPPPDDEPAHEVEPDQIDDEIHQLGADDYEEVEHTHVGEVIAGFEQHAHATMPAADQAEIAQRLDQHLADVEAAHEDDDLGIREASGLHDLLPQPIVELKSGRLPAAEIYDDGDEQADEVDDDLDDQDDDAPEPTLPPAQVPLPPEYQQDFIHRFDEEAVFEQPAYQDEAESRSYNESYTEEAQFAQQFQQPQYAEQPQYGEPTGYADQTVDAYGQTVDAEMHGYAAPAPQPVEPAPEPEEELIEEIDDFEILAEADEEDADLLTSHGEADASGQIALPRAGSQERAGSQPIPTAASPHQSGRHVVPGRSSAHVVRRGSQPSQQQPVVQAPKPRDSDFAMRLDLGDEEEHYPQAAEAVPAPMNLEQSAGHALAGFESEEEPSANNYTLAETPHLEDESRFGFTPPGRFDQSDVVPIAPVARTDWNEGANQWVEPPPPAPPIDDGDDLESALQALDVDLDDLAGPHASTEIPGRGVPRRTQIRPPSSAQVPGRAPRAQRQAPRASTDDGVMIDFDDDEE